jgi:hypothetical protein
LYVFTVSALLLLLLLLKLFSTLIRPPMTYTNWEADKLQGCLCDPGWEGYDCSYRSCPTGADPTVPSDLTRSTTGRAQEVFVLECQADAGYFSILALGHYTEPIPYDAEPGYIQGILEQLTTFSGSVEVKMLALPDTGNLPSVCASNTFASTEIVFSDYRGDRPPMMVTRNTSDTRMWPGGSQQLSLGGSPDAALLRFATKHTLTCPACPACFGNIHMQYRTSITDPVNVTVSGGSALLEAAIAGLEDLQAAQWTNLRVNVTVSDSSGRICSGVTPTTINVDLYSDYGNIPFLTLLDASYLSAVTATQPANITMTTNAAVDEVFECSNQGTCDYGQGQCTCFQAVVGGDVRYRAASSDGAGNQGLRGDCGYLDVPLASCSIYGLDICNGRGSCDNTTFTCNCLDGYSGLTCEKNDCPMVSCLLLHHRRRRAS